MSTVSTITRNIVSNWTGFAFQILITFLLTPFIIEKLGTTYYGLWALINGLTGYYGLLDLGFSAGLTQYIARYLAVRDYKKINETASTGFVILAGCAAVLIVISAVLAFTAAAVFKIPADSAADARSAILIVGIGAALQFLFFPFSAVFPAAQRFDIANAIGIGTRLGFAALTYFVLSRGYGLVGLSAATVACNFIDYLLRWFYAHRILPSLKISLRLAHPGSAVELAKFGFWNVLISGSIRLISYSDAIVIGIFMPPAAITPFALATSLNDYFMRLFVPIGQVFFPAFTERDAQGDTAGVRKIFLQGTRLLASLALPSAAVAFAFSHDFFALWIGEPARAGVYPAAAILFSILLIASVFNAVQRVAYQVLLGTRRLRIMALIFLVEATANIAMSVALIGDYGLLGVAMGMVIPAIVVEGIVFPVVVCRLQGIGFGEYVSRVYVRGVIITVLLAPFLYLIRTARPSATWGSFASSLTMVGVFTALLVVALGLNREERARFILNPVLRLRARILPKPAQL